MRKRKQTSHGKATRWPAVGRRTRGAIEQAAPVEKAADAAKADPALVDEAAPEPILVDVSGVSRHPASRTCTAAEQLLAVIGRQDRDPLREANRAFREANEAECDADHALASAQDAVRLLRKNPELVSNPRKVLARLRSSQKRAAQAMVRAMDRHQGAFKHIEETLCSALRLQAMVEMQRDYFRRAIPISDREGMLLVATGVEPARSEALIQKIQAVCAEFQAIDPVGFSEVRRKASNLIASDRAGSLTWRPEYGADGQILCLRREGKDRSAGGAN
jgi:hypothetical protein